MGGANVADVGNVPRADVTSRMEMRLFRETRSVLEYLCQRLSTIRSLDTYGGLALQFPQDSSTKER